MTKIPINDELKRRFLIQMLRVRMFEEKIDELYLQGKLPGSIHTSIGQEAVSVGVLNALREDDLAIGSHRCHGYWVTKGMDVKGMFAELYGKRTGACKGKADVKRRGKDLTLVTFSHMVHRSLTAAEELEKEGIDVEVIDLRTLAPLDKEAILRSIKQTHRLVVVEEGCKTGGAGAEISAIVAEEAMDDMDAPIRRVATDDTPIPFSPPLEKFVIPDEERIKSVVREMLS